MAKQQKRAEKYSKSKYSKADLEKLAKKYRKASYAKTAKLSPGAAKLFREASQKQSQRAIKGTKRVTKKLLGKSLAKKIPGVGAAILAHDVMRAGSKKGCIERGGEWVGSGMKGRCKVAKKTKKTGGPDPRFAKSRRTKSKK